MSGRYERVLVVTSVDREAATIPDREDIVVVTSGVGRTNAAATTTEVLIERGPFDAVLNIGVAGTLAPEILPVGSPIVGASSVYVEEGLITPDGFEDMIGLGFPLGDFAGNVVPGHVDLVARATEIAAAGVIATVATCSGTADAVAMVRERTHAIAEAMEGAAVVHAARRRGVPAMEFRVISNTTGDRSAQFWDLPAAFASLSEHVPALLEVVLD
ncbi:MAG: futalosine hydrolase [Planctomycetota bacterium]